MRRIIFLFWAGLFNASPLWGREADIEVFPFLPFHQYVIYGNLVIFWTVVLALIVIIRMKLKEIKRVQRMGLKDGRNAPSKNGDIKGV